MDVLTHQSCLETYLVGTHGAGQLWKPGGETNTQAVN